MILCFDLLLILILLPSKVIGVYYLLIYFVVSMVMDFLLLLIYFIGHISPATDVKVAI